MTSKTSSQILTDALTSRQWIDPLQSTVDVNVTDGLFAIANAINRVADIYEKSSAMILQHSEVIAQMRAMMETQKDGPGHA
jgi:hypothetical protein